MAYLLVIPSIDIKDGKTVRVVQGIPELNCNEYGNDPVEMASIWRTENAKMLHIVDFDATFEGSTKNFPIVRDICKNLIIPVEYTGGIRSLEDAEKIFDLGVTRIALATMPIEKPVAFSKVFDKYGPSKVVVCIESIDNEIVIRGRKHNTGIDPISYALDLSRMGVERFLVTDVKRNGMLNGPNIELSKNIAEATRKKVTHSGGIRNKDELMDLQNLLPIGVDSVIVGRALYENRFPCQKLWRIAESGIFG